MKPSAAVWSPSVKRGLLAVSLQDWLEVWVVAIVVAMVAYAAAAFGAVAPRWELPWVVGGLLLTVMTLVAVWRQRPLRHAYVPLGLLTAFALLVMVQCLPFPAEMVGLLSPQRQQSVSELLESPPTSYSLSYYPTATKHGLRLLLIGMAVFASVAVCLDRRRNVQRLLLGLFVAGSAEALLALVQIVSGAEGIYWTDLSAGGVKSGSFVNHSNFAQFLNLTAGAGIGLLLWRWAEETPAARTGIQPMKGGNLWQQEGWLVAGLALHAIAIVASLSRNGVLSMLIASSVVAMLVARHKRLGPQMWLMVVIPLLVFGGGVFVGFDAIYERLATLQQRESYASRWELAVATLRMAGEHLLVGTGLETYAYVFPAYDTSGQVSQAWHADNDYAQLLAETGVVGCGLVLLFGGWLLRTVIQRLAHQEGAERFALYGVVYGMVAVAVQSLTDFGQHLPAVFTVSAAFCGICCALSADHRQAESTSHRLGTAKPQWLLKIGRAIVTLLVLWISGWAVAGAVRDFRADRWWVLSQDLQRELLVPKEERELQDYIDLVAATEAAALIHPEDVNYAFKLNTYRWQMLVDLSGRQRPTLDVSGEERDAAQKIVDQLAQARRLCPTFGPVYTIEGRIRLGLQDESGARLVRLGAQLNPHDPPALMTAAQLAAMGEEKQPEEAHRLLQQLVALDSRYLEPAASMCIELLQRPKWARELAGQNVSGIERVVELMNRLGRYPELAQQWAAEAKQLQKERILRGEGSPADVAGLAKLAAAEGNGEEAVQLYRQALRRGYGQFAWRLRLVDALMQLGRYREAEREVRICLSLRPHSEEAKQRLAEISLQLPAESSAESE